MAYEIAPTKIQLDDNTLLGKQKCKCLAWQVRLGAGPQKNSIGIPA